MTPFSLILNLLTHYFNKILHPIGSKFVSRAEPGYRIFDEVPPSPPRVYFLSCCYYCDDKLYYCFTNI